MDGYMDECKLVAQGLRRSYSQAYPMQCLLHHQETLNYWRTQDPLAHGSICRKRQAAKTTSTLDFALLLADGLQQSQARGKLP
jgi:hypothetical protein